ncbi:MAG TPA: hypothetical protein VD970_09500 [Acetobacteraceae bacterium]|nr:hypothetical protein [Acetobacteraceae bacterium]
MSTLRAILFATGALCASVSFAMAAFGSPASAACTPAGIEQRLAALEAAAQTSMPADPAAQHRMAESVVYARLEAARFSPADRHQACRFLDRMLAASAAATR